MAFVPFNPRAVESYLGVHADVKPTDATVVRGALAYETDTADWYIYNGTAWHLVASGFNPLASPLPVSDVGVQTGTAAILAQLGAAADPALGWDLSSDANLAKVIGQAVLTLAAQQTVTPVEDPTAAANLHERLAGLLTALQARVSTVHVPADDVTALIDTKNATVAVITVPAFAAGSFTVNGNIGGTDTGGLYLTDVFGDPLVSSITPGGLAVFYADVAGYPQIDFVGSSDLDVAGVDVTLSLLSGSDPFMYQIWQLLRSATTAIGGFGLPAFTVQGDPNGTPLPVAGHVSQSTPLALELVSLATRESADIPVTGSGLSLVVTLANKANSGSFTPKVQGKTASGDYYDLWIAAAAVTSNSTKVYQIGRSTSTATQVTESKVVQLPAVVRVVLTSNGNGTTDAFDTTVDIDVTP